MAPAPRTALGCCRRGLSSIFRTEAEAPRSGEIVIFLLLVLCFLRVCFFGPLFFVCLRCFCVWISFFMECGVCGVLLSFPVSPACTAFLFFLS
jgi:hypothetical protein